MPFRHAVIVSRPNCRRCDEIEGILLASGLEVSVMDFALGAPVLAKYNHTPVMLPTTLLFEDDKLLFAADGLAEFMENWESLS